MKNKNHISALGNTGYYNGNNSYQVQLCLVQMDRYRKNIFVLNGINNLISKTTEGLRTWYENIRLYLGQKGIQDIENYCYSQTGPYAVGFCQKYEAALRQKPGDYNKIFGLYYQKWQKPRSKPAMDIINKYCSTKQCFEKNKTYVNLYIKEYFYLILLEFVKQFVQKNVTDTKAILIRLKCPI